MKLRACNLCLAILMTAFCGHAAAVSAQAGSYLELEDDQKVRVDVTGDKKLPFKFNHNRPFLISINRALPESDATRDALVKLLEAEGRLGDVLFNRFGSASPASVQVLLGKRVPVEIAQAVIRVLTGVEKLPVFVFVAKEDSIVKNDRTIHFGYTQRVIVGSLREHGGAPLSKEKVSTLLRAGITQKQFFKLLPEAK